MVQVESPILSQFMTIALTTLPVANALTILIVIPSYRRKFLSMLRVYSKAAESTAKVSNVNNTTNVVVSTVDNVL